MGGLECLGFYEKELGGTLLIILEQIGHFFNYSCNLAVINTFIVLFLSIESQLNGCFLNAAFTY